MTCLGCGEWSETCYNNNGFNRVEYCPLCGAELDDVGWTEDEDDEEEY